MSEEKKPVEKKAAAGTPKKDAKSDAKVSKAAVGSNKNIAVIRIRGIPKVRRDIKDTMEMLHLHRKQYCIIVKDTPSNMGMVNKCKDYVTWGEVSDDIVKELVSKRGEPNPKDNKITKPFFRLSPPRGGYERKGIKKSFSIGGALGFRGDKMNDLIKRML